MVLLGLSALALLAGCSSPDSLLEEAEGSQVRDENARNSSRNSGSENMAVSNQEGKMNAGHYDPSMAAEALGVSEDALISALGDARINNQTDFTSAAEELGISEDVLRETLLAVPMGEKNGQNGEEISENGNGQGNDKAERQDNRQGGASADHQSIQQGYQDIDFTSASLILGISEEDLITAVEGNLGYGPPNFDAVAATLEITTDELLEAIGHE